MLPNVVPVTEPNTLRSSDIYYQSKQVAAIQNSPSDSFQKPGSAPTAIPTPPFVRASKTEEPNTVQTSDRYYAEGGRSVLQQPVRSGIDPTPPTPPTPTQPTVLGQSTAPRTIHTLQEIPEKIKEVIQLLLDGYTDIRVAVPSQEALAIARTQLELSIAREQITEAQMREVRFGWTQVQDLTVPPPKKEIEALPRVTMDVTADDIPDPRAFVLGQEKQAEEAPVKEDPENCDPEDKEDDQDDDDWVEEEEYVG